MLACSFGRARLEHRDPRHAADNLYKIGQGPQQAPKRRFKAASTALHSSQRRDKNFRRARVETVSDTTLSGVALSVAFKVIHSPLQTSLTLCSSSAAYSKIQKGNLYLAVGKSYHGASIE